MTGPGEPPRDYRHVRESSAARAVVAGASARPGHRGWWWRNATGLVTLAAGVVTLVLLLYPLAAPTTLPPAVHGVWRTDAVGYTERRFELGARSLTFQVGRLQSAIMRYEITRVRQSDTPRGTLFRVEYVDREDEPISARPTFEFVYRAATPSEIVLAHQTGIVWTRGPRRPRAKPAPTDDEPDKVVPVTKRP